MTSVGLSTVDAAILESSLSPADLVQFQGCIFPPLTPQRQQEISIETGNFHAEDGAFYWENMADCHGQALGKAMVVNNELHQTFHKQQEELDSLEERNLHLKELASRAKHLSLVLEKLMTVRELHMEEAVTPCIDAPQGSSKRQRLNEDSFDSVEDMLRDISSRCNAVLLTSSTAPRLPHQSEAIRVFGSFSGIQMSTFSSAVDGAQAEECVSSFKTSVREHGTIRTKVFPHGHAFTSKTQQGGYRFRWVPNHS
ncbi:multicilin [Oryzias melastigma]|nr:multicilin [Oryzias melastigma]